VAQTGRSALGPWRLAGLAVFLVTAALLTGTAIRLIIAVPDTLQEAALGFAVVCASVAAIAMLIDAIDLWTRGRRMTAQGQKMIRLLVLIAVFGALAMSVLGRGGGVIAYLMPALVIYLFMAPRRSQSAAAEGRPSAPSSQRSAPVRARQRRGGKKRR